MSRVRAPSIAHHVFIAMTSFEAILLGIVQGLTEFFPVSSSGHLELGQYLLGLSDFHQYIFFNLICHLGTLFAVFIVFAPQIRTALFSDHKQLKLILLATLPLFPLVLFMKPIKAIFDQPEYLGYCFLFTAFLLYLGTREQPPKEVKKTSRDAMIIGMFQAVAILPGISRSGATLSAGRMLGWQQSDALTFSFLLAIPTILGGVVLESLQIARQGSAAFANVGTMQYFFGFITSFVVGLFALRFLLKLAAKDKLFYFVWYCLALGIFTILYFNFV